MSMKLSVSIPDQDVKFLDDYVVSQGLTSRSAAIHKAVRLLHASSLGSDYESAWSEWAESDTEAWDATSSDGLK